MKNLVEWLVSFWGRASVPLAIGCVIAAFYALLTDKFTLATIMVVIAFLIMISHVWLAIKLESIRDWLGS